MDEADEDEDEEVDEADDEDDKDETVLRAFAWISLLLVSWLSVDWMLK